MHVQRRGFYNRTFQSRMTQGPESDAWVYLVCKGNVCNLGKPTSIGLPCVEYRRVETLAPREDQSH